MTITNLKDLIINVLSNYGYLENEQDFVIHFAHELMNKGYSISAEHAFDISQNANPEHADIVTWDRDGNLRSIIEVKYKIYEAIDRRGNEISNSTELGIERFKEDLNRIRKFVRNTHGAVTGFAIYVSDNIDWIEDILQLKERCSNYYTWHQYKSSSQNDEQFFFVIVMYKSNLG